MSGGLMQLVAYGAQDVYLTGNPQITFFKVVYRRHTNFAMEVIEHPFTGQVGFNKRVTAKITRDADLVTRMYVKIVLNSVNPQGNQFGWIRRLGHAIVRRVEVDMGGTIMDRQYGTWLDIWYELARKGDHETGYNAMIGDVPEMTNYDTNIKPEYVLYIPLQFWFNRFVGLAVPVIAFQYTDMSINFEFESAENLYVGDCKFDPTLLSIKDATILIDYVYLDSEERRRFAQVGHEYLIEQIQFNGDQLVRFADYRYHIDFNHPVIELFWGMRNGNYTSGKTFVYYTNQDKWDLVEASKIIILKSIAIGNDPTDAVGGDWVLVPALSIQTVGTFNINNQSSQSVYVNATSLSIGDYGITNKIQADVSIGTDLTIDIQNVVTQLTVRDISFPVDQMIDTRFNICDPKVRQFSNYGVLIDGTVNPIETTLIQMNGHDRLDTREGLYYNYVQTDQHHTNTPKDGINVYSFALYPEEHQPSGTANLSRIDTTDLIVSFADPTDTSILPDINIINENTRFFTYGMNYNIMRVYSGLVGIAYSSS
jgi:hypothetical protein